MDNYKTILHSALISKICDPYVSLRELNDISAHPAVSSDDGIRIRLEILKSLYMEINRPNVFENNKKLVADIAFRIFKMMPEAFLEYKMCRMRVLDVMIKYSEFELQDMRLILNDPEFNTEEVLRAFLSKDVLPEGGMLLILNHPKFNAEKLLYELLSKDVLPREIVTKILNFPIVQEQIKLMLQGSLETDYKILSKIGMNICLYNANITSIEVPDKKSFRFDLFNKSVGTTIADYCSMLDRNIFMIYKLFAHIEHKECSSSSPVTIEKSPILKLNKDILKYILTFYFRNFIEGEQAFTVLQHNDAERRVKLIQFSRYEQAIQKSIKKLDQEKKKSQICYK